MEPAIGIIEFNSIAGGIYATDAMAKKAPIEIIDSKSICPGKYMILITGPVADVDESLKAGIEAGEETVTDHFFIPNVHPQVIPAILAATPLGDMRAIGVIETFSVPSTIIAADAAAKAADINLIELRLANGLGGKSYLTLTGELHDVEIAVDAGVGAIEDIGALVRKVVIPRPMVDLGKFIV